MLFFAVYDETGSPAADWSLQHAHLMGANEIGMSADITFRDGMVVCDKRSEDSAALVLLVDVGEHGRLVLPTCLLPGRDDPYVLLVELARHRLKLIINKLEDWMLFELDAAHPIMQRIERARDLFTQALVCEASDPARAQELARQSLHTAIDAGEMLTFLHADSLLAKRFAAGGMPQRALGCWVHMNQFSEPLGAIVKKTFDMVSIPIRWKEIEPEEGEYDWRKTDQWVDWAAREGVPVVLGPIIDFRTLSAPEWLYIWEHDYDTLYDMLHEHVEAVVTRYKDKVAMWNVASSLHINASFTLAYDQLMEVVRMSTTLVKSLHPGGRVLVEITQPFGEYFATNTKSVPPIVYAEVIAQEAFKVDAIGINVQVGHSVTGKATRDFLQISHLLDQLLFLDLPIVVTGMAAPSHRPKVEEPDPAGFYREAWQPMRQGWWLHKALSIALSRSYIESATCQELFDHATSELPGAGLITSTGRPKPALGEMALFQEQLKWGSLRCTMPEERLWDTGHESSKKTKAQGQGET